MLFLILLSACAQSDAYDNFFADCEVVHCEDRTDEELRPIVYADCDADGEYGKYNGINPWQWVDELPEEADCDDRDATIFPGAPELCNYLDNDCDGVLDNLGGERARPCSIVSDYDGALPAMDHPVREENIAAAITYYRDLCATMGATTSAPVEHAPFGNDIYMTVDWDSVQRIDGMTQQSVNRFDALELETPNGEWTTRADFGPYDYVVSVNNPRLSNYDLGKLDACTDGNQWAMLFLRVPNDDNQIVLTWEASAEPVMHARIFNAVIDSSQRDGNDSFRETLKATYACMPVWGADCSF